VLNRRSLDAEPIFNDGSEKNRRSFHIGPFLTMVQKETVVILQ